LKGGGVGKPQTSTKEEGNNRVGRKKQRLKNGARVAGSPRRGGGKANGGDGPDVEKSEGNPRGCARGSHPKEKKKVFSLEKGLLPSRKTKKGSYVVGAIRRLTRKKRKQGPQNQ